jgi:hypothetical protein
MANAWSAIRIKHATLCKSCSILVSLQTEGKVNTIEKVVDILRGFPEIPYEFREDAIRVLKRSDNGYEVALLIQPHGYTVCLATWHREFGDEYDAKGTFFAGLTDQYRLEVFSRGNVDYRWRIQYREFNDWINGSIVGIFSYPFWKRKRVRYLQNDWLSLSHMSDIAKRSSPAPEMDSNQKPN